MPDAHRDPCDAWGQRVTALWLKPDVPRTDFRARMAGAQQTVAHTQGLLTQTQWCALVVMVVTAGGAAAVVGLDVTPHREHAARLRALLAQQHARVDQTRVLRERLRQPEVPPDVR